MPRRLAALAAASLLLTTGCSSSSVSVNSSLTVTTSSTSTAPATSSTVTPTETPREAPLDLATDAPATFMGGTPHIAFTWLPRTWEKVSSTEPGIIRFVAAEIGCELWTRNFERAKATGDARLTRTDRGAVVDSLGGTVIAEWTATIKTPGGRDVEVLGTTVTHQRGGVPWRTHLMTRTFAASGVVGSAALSCLVEKSPAPKERPITLDMAKVARGERPA